MTKPVTFEQVRDYLCQHWAVSPQRLAPETQLLDDLNLDGDDAIEILRDFAKRFEVDLSSLDFRSHFGSEADAELRWLLRKLFGRDALRKEAVTLQDLVDAANRGKWGEHEKHEDI